MLSAQEVAWIIYTVFFAVLSIILAARCCHNLLLLPFVLFGLLTSIALIVMLSAHYGFTLTSDWSSKSLVLNVLPVISILVLLGIMEAQILFIRHVAAALYNRERWRSIYLRDSEKSEGFPRAQERHSLRPWNYWTSVIVLLVYAIIIVCCIVIQISTSTVQSVAMPICITILWILTIINCFVIWKSSRFGNVRQNRDDLFFLRIVPLLFSMSMMGMCLLGWIRYGAGDDYHISIWILLESLFVYLPLILLLVMCIHVRKFKTMGRQYPNQYSQRTMSDISFVTRKLTEDEVNKRFSHPPSSYYPH